MDEQKIHELNAHLEEEIRETREARQRAEESDRLKSAFLANMSHEIRTPLNAILGFTQILNAEDDISPKERKDYISIINQNSESLQQIISDVLDISKLETHQLVIKNKPFDVMQVLNELHTLFKQKLGSMGKEQVQLKMKKKAGPLWLNTDKIRLIQIFSNLLSNSAKFTNQGMIRFGISRVSDEWIELFVSDTGIGIKPEYLDTIFERFRQVDNSLTRVYGGVGLGLAIVKNLIGLMKGEIAVKSVIGQGTTFTFSLPVVIHPQTKISETGVLNGNAAGS
jgi:signal transduction histidine kinase